MSLRLTTMIVFFLSAIISLPAENRYGSDLLYKLSKAACISSMTDTLRQGTYDNFLYQNHPLRVSVSDSVVRHVGYKLFDGAAVKSIPKSVTDFLERYMLQKITGIHRASTFRGQMKEDEVRFVVGSPDRLCHCLSDSSLKIEFENYNGKTYTLTVSDSGGKVCAVSFPVDCYLLFGADIGELQTILVSDIQALTALDSCESVPDIPFMPEKFFEPDIFVVRGSTFNLETLNGNSYYCKDTDNKYELIFSKQYPVESFANLFTTNAISNNIAVEIKIVLYDFDSALVTVPLTSLLRYFRLQGCKTYFGLIERTESEYVSELLFENKEYGYCHIMRINSTIENINKQGSSMKARMNCFIPISKIKTLFEEYQ